MTPRTLTLPDEGAPMTINGHICVGRLRQTKERAQRQQDKGDWQFSLLKVVGWFITTDEEEKHAITHLMEQGGTVNVCASAAVNGELRNVKAEAFITTITQSPTGMLEGELECRNLELMIRD